MESAAGYVTIGAVGLESVQGVANRDAGFESATVIWNPAHLA
jgi:hypothetical protein